jgi:hypothetical protein
VQLWQVWKPLNSVARDCCVAGFIESAENDSEGMFHGRRSQSIMTAAGVIAIGTLSHYWNPNCRNWSAALFSLSQGLQNGVTSRFSSFPLRTSHMTGAVTDLGLYLGELARAFKTARPPPPPHKAGLMCVFLTCFALGGYVVSCTRESVELVWGAHVVHQEKKHVLVALFPAALLAFIGSGNHGMFLTSHGHRKPAYGAGTKLNFD